MKRALLTWSRVAVFVLVGSSSSRALACCDDFWSCAGAFFTAGASCAVEAAQNAIKDFVDRLQQTRTQGEQQMQATTRDLDREAAGSCQAEDDRVARGYSDVSSARASASAAISAKASTLPANVLDTLHQAQAKLDQMQAEAKTLRDESAAKLAESATVRRAKINALDTAFQATFVAPLAGLVAPLVAALDPISAAATIAVLADQLTRIQNDTERAIAQGVDAFDAAVNHVLEDLKAKSQTQDKRAEDARALGAAVQALASAPTEANRGRVARLLVNPARASMPRFRFIKLNLKAVAVTKTTTVPALRSALIADAKFARGVKVRTQVTFDKAAAEQRTRSELDKRLQGKTGEALETERKKLLGEAAQHFQKDPKALAAVQKAINEEVDKRKPAPAKLQPMKPVARPAPIRK